MQQEMDILPLTPIDHVFTGHNAYPITFALRFDYYLDPLVLSASLDETVEVFWPLRSLLTEISPNSYGFRHTPEGGGLIFRVVESEDMPVIADDSHRYVDQVESLPGESLTKIILTQTGSGSILGVSISHALVDGFSMFHFLSSWARRTRGRSILKPMHDRAILIPGKSQASRIPGDDDLLEHCGLFAGGNRSGAETAPASEIQVTLSVQELTALRDEATRSCDTPLFDNDILTAFLWKKYGISWTDPDDGLVYVTMPVDVRRIVRKIPRMYFGAGLAFATAFKTRDGLIRGSLGEIAQTIRKSVSRISEDVVWNSMRTLQDLRLGAGMDRVQNIAVTHPERGLVVTNISRLPLGDVDFGQGPPTEFKATAQTQRAAVIMPSEGGAQLRVFPPAGAQ